MNKKTGTKHAIKIHIIQETGIRQNTVRGMQESDKINNMPL